MDPVNYVSAHRVAGIFLPFGESARRLPSVDLAISASSGTRMAIGIRKRNVCTPLTKTTSVTTDLQQPVIFAVFIASSFNTIFVRYSTKLTAQLSRHAHAHSTCTSAPPPQWVSRSACYSSRPKGSERKILMTSSAAKIQLDA
jgi:hypothetical protein